MIPSIVLKFNNFDIFVNILWILDLSSAHACQVVSVDSLTDHSSDGSEVQNVGTGRDSSQKEDFRLINRPFELWVVMKYLIQTKAMTDRTLEVSKQDIWFHKVLFCEFKMSESIGNQQWLK